MFFYYDTFCNFIHFVFLESTMLIRVFYDKQIWQICQSWQKQNEFLKIIIFKF